MANKSYAPGMSGVNGNLGNLSMRGVPIKGIFTVSQWADEFEMKPDTFRTWIQKYKIPYFKPGDTMYVRAEDFWSRVPYFTHAEEHEG